MGTKTVETNQLSRRLQGILRLVPEGGAVADVGTDHGYIPIYLLQHHLAHKVIATDVREGPLSRARAHLIDCGLEDQISLRLSDGLAEIIPGEVDTVILSGMGGPLILRILREGEAVVKELSCLVLQPQSEIASVRQYLNQNGWIIRQEDLVQEEGKFYPMMQASPGGPEDYQPYEYQYGRRLLEQHHPVLRKYLQKQQMEALQILQTLPEDDQEERIRQRRNQLTTDLDGISQALSCYEREEK